MKSHSALGLILVLGLALPAVAGPESLFRHSQTLPSRSLEQRLLSSNRDAREKIQRVFTPQASEAEVLSLFGLAKRFL
ncbi:MAG: hypothetical protein ACM3YO_05945 [Bacteroidota bacterium]